MSDSVSGYPSIGATLDQSGFPKRSVVGIQGGRGSFNEEAAFTHLESVGVKAFDLSYLYTSENVLSALEKGEIDFGQFAIRNTLGGEVAESVKAMAGREFVVVAEYKLKIAHALMIGPQSQIADIDTLLTHPQVLLQCQNNLKSRYAHLKLISGEGEQVDPAKVAELMGHGKMPTTTATASSKVLARLCGLTIVEENLQDRDDNFTTFLLVRRS